jgi:hypothetical protein
MIRNSWGYLPRQRVRPTLYEYHHEQDGWRYCNIIERNGNLTYIEDAETGECGYYAPHEIR